MSTRGAWELTAAASEEPVTLDEAKLQIRQDLNDVGENSRIQQMISAGRAWVENLTRKRLITQTWRLWLDSFPIFPTEDDDCDDAPSLYAIKLPFAPVSAISGISYYDGNNALQTLDTATYQTDLVSLPARILPAFGYFWPITYPRLKAVRLDFTVGYGAASAVPDAFKNAIKLHVQGAYDGVDNSEAIKNLLQEYTAVA
jgi:uncharacterized phiE125 gp8 family phage protein